MSAHKRKLRELQREYIKLCREQVAWILEDRNGVDAEEQEEIVRETAFDCSPQLNWDIEEWVALDPRLDEKGWAACITDYTRWLWYVRTNIAEYGFYRLLDLVPQEEAETVKVDA